MCLAWSGPAFSQGQRLRRQGCRRVCPRHAPAWSGGCGLCGRSPGAPGRSCPHGRAARSGTRASAAGLWESSSDSRPSAGIASTARAHLGRRASARLSPNPSTLQAMGMEVSVIAACDQKASARKFIRTNHEVRHLFHSLAAMGGVQPARDGRPNGHVNQPACACDICQKPHDLQEEPPADWITGGLPCQSFSAMRQKEWPWHSAACSQRSHRQRGGPPGFRHRHGRLRGVLGLPGPWRLLHRGGGEVQQRDAAWGWHDLFGTVL